MTITERNEFINTLFIYLQTDNYRAFKVFRSGCNTPSYVVLSLFKTYLNHFPECSSVVLPRALEYQKNQTLLLLFSLGRAKSHTVSNLVNEVDATTFAICFWSKRSEWFSASSVKIFLIISFTNIIKKVSLKVYILQFLFKFVDSLLTPCIKNKIRFKLFIYFPIKPNKR